MWGRAKRKKGTWMYLAVPTLAALASYQLFKNYDRIKDYMGERRNRGRSYLDRMEEDEFGQER